MNCERCETRESAVPYTTVEKGEQKVIQLCLACLTTFDWDTRGVLTGTDLANLGFAPQSGWKQVLAGVEKAGRAGKVQTKEEALDYARKHPALRIRPSDVRFQTIYVPVGNWNLRDPRAGREQPGFEEQVRWWKAESEAGRMVMYGIGIDRPPGMVMVGWTCATLEEAEGLAHAAPWVCSKILAVQETIVAERR